MSSTLPPPPPNTVRAGPSPPPPQSDLTRETARDLIVVTRSVVIMQGTLLLLLALLGFVSGYFVARSYGPGTSAPQPSFITGKVQYRKPDGTLTPDEAATVLLLPVEGLQDRTSKLPVFGLRPQDYDGGPSATHSDALRAIGGDLCRASGDGFYHLRVRDSGDYFLLYLSAHLQRDTGDAIDRQMLAELGRYVDRANELIGASAFVWKRVTIENDQQMNEVFQ